MEFLVASSTHIRVKLAVITAAGHLQSCNWNRLVVLNRISIILLCIYLHGDDYIPIQMVIMLQRFFRDPVSAMHMQIIEINIYCLFQTDYTCSLQFVDWSLMKYSLSVTSSFPFIK